MTRKSPEETHSGGCLCGAVRFAVKGALQPPDACHCRSCRRQSGHFWASTDAQKSAVSLKDEENALRWYRSSDKVRRGFCGHCGSTLFWDPLQRDFLAIAMGAFDQPTGVMLKKHIFVEEKGDYYAIADGLPQNPR